MDISRINPGAGLKRLFGADSLVEAGKSLVKVAVLAVVLWRVLLADLPGLMLAPFGDTSRLLARAARPVLHVLLVVVGAQAAAGRPGRLLGVPAAFAFDAHEPPGDHRGAEGDGG